MKKIIRSASLAILLISLLSLCVLSASAADPLTGSCGDEVTWTLDTATGAMVISGRGPMTDYAISQMPPWISSCGSITSVTVEEGVTSLGAYVFLYCNELTEISLPESLTVIGANAFSGCSALKTIDIPAGVHTIGSGAFLNCTSLEEIVIPAGVTDIPASTFSNCAGLTSMELPDGIKTIGSSAFMSCSTLTYIDLPEGLTAIDSKAFAYCTALETVSLPSTLTTLGNNVFAGVPLRMVLYEGAQDEWDAVSVGSKNELLTSVLLIHPGHLFDREIVGPAFLRADASCTAAASYYRSCACGEAGEETFSYGEPLGHTGGSATCRDQAVCQVCGESYGVLGVHVPDGEATCTEGFGCAICGIPLKDPLGHDHITTVTPPTCTEPGFTTHVCSRCEDTFTDTPTDPTGHTEGTAPTCTEDQTCTVCQAVLTERLGHDHVPSITLAPTCTEAGLRTHTCSRCSDTYDETVDPTGHLEGAPATCETSQTCTACGIVLADPLGHDYSASTVEPTCVAKGYTVHVCARCEHTYHDGFIPANGHAPGAEATCTAPQVCSVCNGILTEALGHQYALTVTDPTCTAEGYSTHACVRCDHAYRDTYTEVKPHVPGAEATCTKPQLCETCGTVLHEALDHEYTHILIAPTCTTRGYTTHTCSACGHTYLDAFTDTAPHTPRQDVSCHEPQSCSVCGALLKEAEGHDYRATIVEATCDKQGYIHHACARCTASYMDNFTPAKGHTPGEAATCTAPQLCTVCRTVVAPAAGHSYSETVTPPTCTEGGYTTHTCATCANVFVDTPTEPTGHAPGEEATCHAPQTCTVCRAILAERPEHSFEETRVEPTCTVDGQILEVCSLCGDSRLQSVIPATGHTVGDWVLENYPDVGEPGRQHKSCEVCSEMVEHETFWDPDPTDPSVESYPDSEKGSEKTEEKEKAGCQISGGNIAVIIILILAVGLLGFVDLRRR